MDTLKVKLRLGPHEFETEGTKDDIAALFAAWREAAGSQPMPATPGARTGTPAPLASRSQENGSSADPDSVDSPAPLPLTGEELTPRPVNLNRVFSENKAGVIQLIVGMGDNAEESNAILLVLYGYRWLKNIEDVSALRVMASLRESGWVMQRIDRPIQEHLDSGLVLAIGKAKGRRYRITVRGMRRAQELVDGLVRQIE